MSGKGHPLPRSEEARHDEIPEHLEQEKGCGDDARAGNQPSGEAAAPDGRHYPRDRPDTAAPADDLASDQAAHQDRGQSIARDEADRA